MNRLSCLIALVALVACEAAPPPAPTAPAKTSAPVPTPTAKPAPTTPAPAPTGFVEAGGVKHLVRYSGGAMATEELPMVIAIHGLGDRPERFGLMTGYPGKARIIVPRGLSPHGRGFSWFPIRVRQADPEKVAAGMREATEALAAMIGELTTRHPTRGKPVVTGFSQGGMLSFALAVERPDLVAKAVPLAGWLPPPMWPKAKPDGAPPIIALHGDADDVLPIAPTREAVSALQEVGWDVRLVEYPGVPHRVRPDMLRELYRQLAEAAAR